MIYFADWDLVKLDKSVVYKCIDDPDSMLNIVSDASDFGRRKFVFEGVESNHQHQVLLNYHGLHQGFYYSDPIDMANLVRGGV